MGRGCPWARHPTTAPASGLCVCECVHSRCVNNGLNAEFKFTKKELTLSKSALHCALKCHNCSDGPMNGWVGAYGRSPHVTSDLMNYCICLCVHILGGSAFSCHLLSSICTDMCLFLFWKYVSFCFAVSFFPPCYLKEDLWYLLDLEECFPQLQHVHSLTPRGILCGTKDKDHRFFFFCKSSVWVCLCGSLVRRR